ncbi:type 3 dihydrofolate reductase [Aestuariibacter salexigens]|uniref:type 3 dihydrofolate reductase n=1 Tax=Aestuariibacter salexigens TaxID=226010 RepID=UPI00040512DC|nr:type 3 dihydrofolate reductase [Aestuariibacter salexigens]
MIISMIAAMADNRVIGKDNAMPWHLPADLKHFKQITLGKPVVMGRKTYESIGKALPGRLNIVITRDTDYVLEDAVVVNTPDEAVKAAGDVEELMVIGGGAIYTYFLPLCERLYLTHIDLAVDGDTQFPDYESQGNWQLTDESEHVADERNPYDYRFITLARVR